MSLDTTLAAWLSLSQIAGLGNESLRKLLQELGSPEDVLSASTSSLSHVVKPAIAQAISDNHTHEYLSLAETWLNDPLNHIVCIGDAVYPQALLNIHDPPLLLYVKGKIELLNHVSLAIVGSRSASPQGLRNAEAFAQAISDAGIAIISGLAIGIDAAAHMGALKGKGSSIAIVGTGLDRIYPARNRDLAHQLAECGAVVSEFPLGTPPLPANFPRRNRIISGLSLGTLVVEASLQSGSLITARMALEQGREVFAIPGSIHSPQSKGCHALIKQGAKLVESAQDILEELGTFIPSSSLAKNTPKETPLLDHLGYEAVDMDTLSQRSGLTVAALSAILLQLELDGRISSLPGGLYQRID